MTWLDLKTLKEGTVIPNCSIHREIWRGGYPGALDLPDSLMADYFSSYLQTYVERDVRSLSDIENLQLFYNFN